MSSGMSSGESMGSTSGGIGSGSLDSDMSGTNAMGGGSSESSGG
jgi:hypothetical protein